MPTYQTTPTVSTFTPTTGTPNRGTTEQDLNAFNVQLRSSPLYQQFMRSRNLPTNGRVKLSRKQQSDLEKAMASAGFKVPSGMHIDQGGNLNQKNRLVRNTAIAAGVAAGTIATLGAAGVISGGVGGGFGLGSAGAASVPGAVSGVVPTTGAMAGGLGTGTVVGGASAAAVPGAIGAAAAPLGTGTVIGGAAGGGLLASAPLASSAAVPLASTVTSNLAGGGMAVPWFDIGKEGVGALTSWIGKKSSDKRNDQASQVAAQGNDAMVALEREKLAEDKRQFDLANAANERNFGIQQEERLEELRRQNEEEAAREPIRMAKEAAYRNYMKKYYGIDVGPSVGKSPRQIAGGATKQPLAAQAAPGAGYGALIAPETQPAVTSSAQDPFMQSWIAPSSDVSYRRKLGTPEEAQA